MPRSKNTPEEFSAMRTRILDAVHVLLEEKGPKPLSMRAIAARVGVSHMVLYTYFENREGLLAAFFARHCERQSARWDDLLHRAQHADVLDVLREALDFYVQLAYDQPYLYRFLWVLPTSAAAVPVDYAAALQDQNLACNIDHLAVLIRIGIARDVFVARDARLAAALVFSMLNGPLLLQHSGRLWDPLLLERLLCEAQTLALHYLCTVPEQAPAAL